jgi:hypothetical protein
MYTYIYICIYIYMVPPLEFKLNRVICPKSAATSKTSFFFWGYHICVYIYIYIHICTPLYPQKHSHDVPMVRLSARPGGWVQRCKPALKALLARGAVLGSHSLQSRLLKRVEEARNGRSSIVDNSWRAFFGMLFHAGKHSLSAVGVIFRVICV